MFWKKYIDWIHRGRWILAPLFILLFLFCANKARHLQLRSDFKELLPDHFQSVKDLNRILARVKSTDTLIVAIESDDPKSSIRFALDLIAKLQKYPPGIIEQIDYNVSDIKKFFEDHKYFYIDKDDLEELHDRLKKRIEREKLKGIGLFLDLETQEEKEAEFSTEDIQAKYKGKTSRYEQYIDGYFFAEQGKLMAIVLRPSGAATGYDFAKKLVAEVEATIRELNPASYHPSMKVGLTGKFKRVLFEYATLLDDILSTSLLVVALVGLAVLLYFKKLRMVILMAWATFNGVIWTFAITAKTIGYLTTQTAFLGAIIVGNGINYSLILMARYLEERKQNKNPIESLEIATVTTWRATLASSLNTAVAFAVLMITQMKGFSQFGFIGGLGMFFCWVATYTVLPVFLTLSEQFLPLHRAGKKQIFDYSFMELFTSRLHAWHSRIIRIGLIFSAVSAIALAFYIPRSLEYDFSKLRVQPKGASVSEEAQLSERVKKIFSEGMTPLVLVTEKSEQVQPLCKEILRKNAQDPPENRVVDDCNNLFSHVPQDQDEKLAILKKIRDLVRNQPLHFLNADQRKELEEFKKQADQKKIDVRDLPHGVVRNYEEKNGDLGKVVFVYPSDKAPLWNGKNLIRFADLVRENKLPTGETVTASGTAVIFADLLRAVIHDGPRATVLSFLAVFFVVTLAFRTWRSITFLIGTLLFGVLWMGGLMAILNIKLNFFNFIAIPVTFGIGVDYGVNILQRYRFEGRGSIAKVIQTTGGAVVLCSLTTLIGYATLIIAKNQALVSFGWIGILGELGCLIAAIVFVPALVIHWESKYHF